MAFPRFALSLFKEPTGKNCGSEVVQRRLSLLPSYHFFEEVVFVRRGLSQRLACAKLQKVELQMATSALCFGCERSTNLKPWVWQRTHVIAAYQLTDLGSDCVVSVAVFRVDA